VHDRHDLTNAEWDRLEPLLPDRTPGWGESQEFHAREAQAG
jgi:transposase